MQFAASRQDDARTSIYSAWAEGPTIVRAYYHGNTGLKDRGEISFHRLARQWRREAFVDFDLIAGDELVGFVGHADDGLEFLEHGVGHALAEGRSGMRGDAVVAVVGDADGDVEKFLGERIERAGRHDLLDAFPGALEKCGVVGDCFPEIIDPIGLAGGHDVVVDSADFRAGVFVFDQAEGGHDFSRMAASEDGETLAGCGNACQKESENGQDWAGFQNEVIEKRNERRPSARQKTSATVRAKNQVQANANPDLGGRLEEFFEQEAGESAGVVAQDAVFFEKIVEDYPEA